MFVCWSRVQKHTKMSRFLERVLKVVLILFRNVFQPHDMCKRSVESDLKLFESVPNESKTLEKPVSLEFDPYHCKTQEMCGKSTEDRCMLINVSHRYNSQEMCEIVVEKNTHL